MSKKAPFSRGAQQGCICSVQTRGPPRNTRLRPPHASKAIRSILPTEHKEVSEVDMGIINRSYKSLSCQCRNDKRPEKMPEPSGTRHVKRRCIRNQGSRFHDSHLQVGHTVKQHHLLRIARNYNHVPISRCKRGHDVGRYSRACIPFSRHLRQIRGNDVTIPQLFPNHFTEPWMREHVTSAIPEIAITF